MPAPQLSDEQPLAAEQADQPDGGIELEIVVPAFNEQERIAPTLHALVGHLRSLPLASRIRVIDNGSTDHTADIVERVTQSLGPDMIVISGCSRRGKGSAVARGMLLSNARYVGYCDADLATPAESIDTALEFLKEGWSIVIGSRRCVGATLVAEQPLLRRVGGKAFHLAARALAGEIHDTQCGFKFFEQGAARRIFSHTAITGFAFDLEVIARARALNLPVKEFPVDWSDRPGSTFQLLRDGTAVLSDLWWLRRAELAVPATSA